MSELDSAGNKSGEDQTTSWIMPGLTLLALLAGAAALRLLPGLRDRLAGLARQPTTIDLIDATETETVLLPPMAWVWSQYRGVLEPAADSVVSEPQKGAAVASAARELVDAASEQIAGLSPTSLAWVWSEYRGAV